MDLAAYILIGGRSTRFGSDKAFAEIGGETLAERALGVVGKAYPDAAVRFVAASEDQFGAEIAKLGSETVFDIKPGLGAWSGLHAALAYSTAKWTLVMACDLPLVTARLLQRLGRERSDETDAVVPRQHDGRFQPLCAVYRTATARDAVERHIAAGERLPPLQLLFEELKARVVDVGDNTLRNVNIPEDLT